MHREEKFMSSTKPVVVYGASGYTGRLVCEYLREFCVPFIAAGRDKARIQEALALIPGINTVDHEVVEVDHEIGPLSDLFARAKVVCNTVGPFAMLGRQVVEACVRAGSHYVDTTGEQDWLIECDETYGAEMAAKGLLLSPGTAQMYTTGEIAANLCLETPGLDTLDILVFWKGAPTIASTQTILVNAAMSKAYYLEQNEYVEWPSDGGLYDVTVPGGLQRAEPNAAAGEPADQHLLGFGPRLGTPRQGALRDPRQLQLQANRATSRVRRVLAAPATAQASWLRLCLPGLRPPRIAWRAAELRARYGADSHRAPVTDRGPV